MATKLLKGQLVNTSQQMGLASIPSGMNVHVGSAITVIEDPANLINSTNNSRYLLLNVEKGSFRILSGDASATIGAYAVPTAEVVDGSSSMALEQFEVYVFTAPDRFTVVGSAFDSVLSYSWIGAV